MTLRRVNSKKLKELYAYKGSHSCSASSCTILKHIELYNLKSVKMFIKMANRHLNTW